ncbi:hypothetical protein B7494_g1099 [Chlorociboria aeruginascens]|nr:hypothetical protein B7494_g1099 [Chlorociboria aeruginascens]
MMRKLEDLNKVLESSEFRRGYILFFTFTFGFTLIFSLVFYIKSPTPSPTPTPTPTPTASTKEAKAQCYRASKQNWRYYRSNVSPRCRLQTQPHPPPPSQNEIESYIKPELGLMGTAKEEEIFRRQSSISEMKNPHLPEHSASQDVGTMDEIVDDPEIDSSDSCESRKSHGIESDKLLKPVKYRHKEKKTRHEEDEEIDLGDYESLEFGADFVEVDGEHILISNYLGEGSKLDGEALSFAVKAQMLPMHPMMYEETDDIVYNEELGENVAYGFIAEERQATDIKVRKMWQKVRNCADLSESSNRLYHQIRRQRPDEKILVFSQYLKFLDLTDETIKRKYNVQSLRFESTVTQVRRVQVQNDFEAAHPSVHLLMTAGAGEFGLNITAASVVIQCELWWNESNELQAICRAHRKKQTRDVLAVQLFGSNSDIDWEILGTQKRKATVNSDLMEAIIRKPDDGPDIRELYSHPVPHPIAAIVMHREHYGLLYPGPDLESIKAQCHVFLAHDPTNDDQKWDQEERDLHAGAYSYAYREIHFVFARYEFDLRLGFNPRRIPPAPKQVRFRSYSNPILPVKPRLSKDPEPALWFTAMAMRQLLRSHDTFRPLHSQHRQSRILPKNLIPAQNAVAKNTRISSLLNILLSQLDCPLLGFKHTGRMPYSSKRSNFRCPRCYKGLAGLTGVDRHKCKPSKQAPKRKRPTFEPLVSAGSAAYEIPLQNTSAGSELTKAGEEEYILPYNRQEIGSIDIYIPDLVEDEPVEHRGLNDLQNEYAYRPIDMEYLVTERSRDVPNSNETSNETPLVTELVYFQEDGDTGCFPGQPVPLEDIKTQEKIPLRPKIQADNPWYPFASRHDWDLMSWFAKDRTSKQSIEEWFKNPLFATSAYNIPGAMKSYNDMMKLIYQIPYGIQRNDEWHERPIEFRSQIQGGKPELHMIRYRPIQYCLEFLLGHKPFAADLVWGPVQKSYGPDGDRVYDEMHTGTWWWDTQAKLPSGATVVPIILATDKTLMTHLRGDRVAWPVYMTIGNLPRRIRRKQTLLATLLIGLLPISKDITKLSDLEMAYIIRSEIYHKAMEIILEPLESLTKTGWNIRCADDEIRHCFPVLSNMLVDYEEVTLITGIKKNHQCGTCQVPGKELENISKQWPLRTHQQMKNQMTKQLREKISPADKDWVHSMTCFAWKHSFVNIHEVISIDLLHQLQKGVFRDAMGWTVQLIEELIPGLKHFNSFSHITQWTGSEEEDLVRIIVPVLAPLLIAQAPYALHYIRALALYRIEQTREAFAAYRPIDKDNNAHWNTPKFHSLSHYPDFIRRYGAPNGFDTGHMEAPHKFLLKSFYERSNKNNTWTVQIASHNSRDTNRKAMNHHLLDFFTTSSNIGTTIEAHVITMTATPMNPKTLGCRDPTWEDVKTFSLLQLDKKLTTTAAEADRALCLKGFIEALVIFIRRSRAELKKENISDDDQDKSKLKKMNFGGALLIGEIRAAGMTFAGFKSFPPPDRHDTSLYSNPLNGQRVGQLQALIKIVDIGYYNSFTNSGVPSYCAALVDIYPLKNTNAKPHPVHGMIEVTRPPIPTADRPRVLKGRRFYNLSLVLRSAHIIPASNNILEKPTDIFYINNYIDWDQYQVLYEDGWEKKAKAQKRSPILIRLNLGNTRWPELPMRDYIGEKRLLLWKTIRDIVQQEYATDSNNKNPATHYEFWRQKSENHAILSPDSTKIGWQKWTSNIIIKGLMVFYISDNMWSKTPVNVVPKWWDPIPGFTIVAVCTMIIAACEEQSAGTKVRFQHDNFKALFMEVKNSWQRQDTNKEVATRLLVSKKVRDAVASKRNFISMEPFPNDYEDTLSDLLDYPDFAEITIRYKDIKSTSEIVSDNALEASNNKSTINNKRVASTRQIEPVAKRQRPRQSRTQRTRAESNLKILVKFNNDPDDTESIQAIKILLDCIWEQFTDKFGQDPENIMFWYEPEVWDKSKRTVGSHAICDYYGDYYGDYIGDYYGDYYGNYIGDYYGDYIGN